MVGKRNRRDVRKRWDLRRRKSCVTTVGNKPRNGEMKNDRGGARNSGMERKDSAYISQELSA
jgi:hypothetical protein